MALRTGSSQYDIVPSALMKMTQLISQEISGLKKSAFQTIHLNTHLILHLCILSRKTHMRSSKPKFSLEKSKFCFYLLQRQLVKGQEPLFYKPWLKGVVHLLPLKVA